MADREKVRVTKVKDVMMNIKEHNTMYNMIVEEHTTMVNVIFPF
jgi:hypothetical protein